MVSELTDQTFSEAMNGNVVIDFYTDWCAPCKAISPIIDRLSKDYNKVKFFKMNIESNNESVINCSIRSVPTIIFLKNGNEINRMSGYRHEKVLEDEIKAIYN